MGGHVLAPFPTTNLYNPTLCVYLIFILDPSGLFQGDVPWFHSHATLSQWLCSSGGIEPAMVRHEVYQRFMVTTVKTVFSHDTYMGGQE